MSAIEVRNDLRLSGRTRRWHTWPHIREQSVGEHSWQLCRLILTICPERSATLLPHAVLHDCGENGAGDPPFPVKRDNPVLKQEMDRIEGDCLRYQLETWDVVDPPEMSQDDRYIFKILEMIEMWEFGLEEERLGNQFAQLVTERCLSSAEEMMETIKLLRVRVFDVDKTIQRIQSYIRTRKEIWNVQ